MVEITVGRQQGDHVRFELGFREHPEATDADDGNWIASRVTVHAGGFHGTIAASLRSEEFARFNGQVQQLSETLTGQAVFDTMEGQMRLVLKADRLGNLAVEGVAMDRAGTGNRLAFSFDQYDQSYLPLLLSELTVALETFPVLGDRRLRDGAGAAGRDGSILSLGAEHTTTGRAIRERERTGGVPRGPVCYRRRQSPAVR